MANLGDGTLKLFQDMIDSRGLVGDFNEDIVDVNRDHKLCDVSDRDKTYLGKVKVDGTCWANVHQSEMNVYDLTGADESMYTINGNNMATIMSMEMFSSSIESNFTVIGRFGDHVDIDNTLPSPLDNQGIQDTYMSLEYNPQGHSVLVCGSPGEIASDPFSGDNGFDVVAPENLRSKSVWELSGQKNTIWSELALNAIDQLRMKTAWSLSQLISVGLPESSEFSSNFEETEERLAFYDFFVKNGFGW